MRAIGTLGKPLWGIVLVGLAATGCTTTSKPSVTSTRSIKSGKVTYNYTAKDRDCLKRAMYFESNRSDPDGYMAVGTVVMNRLTSGAYPDSICGVVAQEKQFAPGVMTREIKPQAEPDLNVAADSILHGKRHPGVKNAMFFHTKGLSFPYNNMHYVAVAGGNAFYEKRDPQNGMLQTPPPLPAVEVAMNYVPSGSSQLSSFNLDRFGAPPAPSAAPQAAPAVFETVASGSSLGSAAPAATTAFVPLTSTAPMNPSFDTGAQPMAVPVPTPMPVVEKEDVPTAQSLPMPADIALPTPRPALHSASLRGRLPQIGG